MHPDLPFLEGVEKSPSPWSSDQQLLDLGSLGGFTLYYTR